jgi:hypothetical protein
LADSPFVPSNPEPQTWPVGPREVDALAIMDVDHPHLVTIDENAGGRTVVDRYPFAPVEAQQQVGAGDQRMGNAHVGTEVASNDNNVMAWRETAL